MGLVKTAWSAYNAEHTGTRSVSSAAVVLRFVMCSCAGDKTEVIMNYVNVDDDEKPRDSVDVEIVTNSGKKGVARYWHTTGQWFTADRNFTRDDRVKKWRYVNAT